MSDVTPDRCCYDSISLPHTPRMGRCSRKAGHGPGLRYCKQHDPVAVKARADKRQREWREDWIRKQDARDYAATLNVWQMRCVAAIEQISAGHNDPSALARELIETRPGAKS